MAWERLYFFCWWPCFVELSGDVVDLQLMLCGMQEIDVDDWQRNTRYKSYTDQSSQVVWFWKVCVSLLFALVLW